MFLWLWKSNLFMRYNFSATKLLHFKSLYFNAGIRINLLCESSDVWKELGCHFVKHSRICKKHLWELSICYMFYCCALNVLTLPDRRRCHNLRCFPLKISSDDYLSWIWMQLIGHNTEQLTFKQESIVIYPSLREVNTEHIKSKMCLFRVLYWLGLK